MKINHTLISFIFFLLLPITPGWCLTIHVPVDYSTIQAAINNAITNDTILIADGIYSGTENKNLDLFGKILFIMSENGPTNCIIDCENSGRGFVFPRNEAQSSTISGLTIRNGYVAGSTSDGCGGAIMCNGNDISITVSNCVFSSNVAQVSGGAFYNGLAYTASPSSITDCVFSNNNAGWGGAMYVANMDVELTNCDFLSNSAEAAGGAIYLLNSDATITLCSFDNNHAIYWDGGAIYISAPGSPHITESTFSHNISLESGGAIYCEDGSSPVIGGSAGVGNTFDGNLSTIGADLGSYSQMSGQINAMYNHFTGYLFSDYYISRRTPFILTNSISDMMPLMQDVYVNPEGDDSHTGITPDSAFRTIQHALSRVYGTSSTPVIIHLSPGTYSPSETGEYFPLPLVNYVSICGTSPRSSILDAQLMAFVCGAYGEIRTAISDVTITGGSSGLGGVTASDSIINMTNCHIYGNAGLNEGGGVTLVAATAHLSNCLISDNSAASNGGGIFATIYCQIDVSNCTIAGNTTEGDGGGLFITNGSNLTISDSIIWGNHASLMGDPIAITAGTGSPAAASIQYTDVQGGPAAIYLQGGSTVDWMTGGIYDDPLFTPGPLGDFYLSVIAAGQTATSPCVNTGSIAASSACYSIPSGYLCMDSLTTRTDIIADDGTVDMGYHYPCQELIILSENMESDPSWTITGGLWEWGAPAGLNGDPTSGYSGTSVYGYNLYGSYEDDIPEYHLITNAIDCSGYQDITLSFYRWLGVDGNVSDHAALSVSNDDGSTWHAVWENPTTAMSNPTEWSKVTYDISTWVDSQSNVRLRWTMGSADGANAYCGWNIDDIVLIGHISQPPLIPAMDVFGVLVLLTAFSGAFCKGIIKRKRKIQLTQ